MKIFIISVMLIFVSGCSFKTPANEWQHKSATAFSSYSQNFLSANDTLAKNDLHRAVEHAKKSANLTQLAKIYLGECALNISAGVKDECSNYRDIADLVNAKELNAYYNFINLSFNASKIESLPSNYKNFATALLKKDFKTANSEIFKIERTSSYLLCAALIKDNLTTKSREKIIKKASFHGYKKVVLFWLVESKKYIKNQKELEKINKKISILTSIR